MESTKRLCLASSYVRCGIVNCSIRNSEHTKPRTDAYGRVIPEPVDCHDPKVWEGDALFRPESRNAFRKLENLGFTDALRAVNDAPETYTFWDYQAGAWQKNNGIRIDHLMLSPEAANLLHTASVEKHVRGWEKPSDHVPVAIQLGL